MTPESFVYWLQGYFELSENNNLSEHQVEVIKKHLNLVLTNVTSSKLGYQLLDTKFTGSSAGLYC